MWKLSTSHSAAGVIAPSLLEALRARPEGTLAPEALWALVDVGQAKDAEVAAAHVASDDYDTAVAGLEAVAGIVEREDLDEGAVKGTAGALERARARLREVHPAGDNLLADRLVERIGNVLAALAT